MPSRWLWSADWVTRNKAWYSLFRGYREGPSSIMLLYISYCYSSHLQMVVSSSELLEPSRNLPRTILAFGLVPAQVIELAGLDLVLSRPRMTLGPKVNWLEIQQALFRFLVPEKICSKHTCHPRESLLLLVKIVWSWRRVWLANRKEVAAISKFVWKSRVCAR